MTRRGYRLTRRAARDLRDINQYSEKQWGQSVADAYMADLYAGFAQIAERPLNGQQHQHRSAPFLMRMVRRHAVIYTLDTDETTVILALLHQARDIEAIVAQLRNS
jgi:toxin ParE1/3/4